MTDVKQKKTLMETFWFLSNVNNLALGNKRCRFPLISFWSF